MAELKAQYRKSINANTLLLSKDFEAGERRKQKEENISVARIEVKQRKSMNSQSF